ncbi:MAG: MFS transporter [Actinobacteria bacterium]|nr:MFS transporter [Actinomycetota bacterium]
MHRRLLLHLDAPPDQVRAAARDALGLAEGPDELSGRLPYDTTGNGLLRAAVRTAPDGGSVAELDVHNDTHVPFFQWFFGPVIAVAVRRWMRHAGATLEAAVTRSEPPPPPRKPAFLPTVEFSDDQMRLLAAVCALGVLASYGAALFAQVGGPVRASFHASKADLGLALAITRPGALIALVLGAAADRRGRRRVMALAFVGLCAANAVAAIAPNIELFTATQLLTRAFVNAIIVVAGIAAVEDAPDGARAFSAMMLGLAAGVGFAISVILLPLADVAGGAWRILFAISGASIVLLPVVMRAMPETRRFRALDPVRSRRRMGDLMEGSYGPRFAILAALAFFASMFSAPSASLTNTFLHDERHFSNSAVALFRTVTNGVPGVVGLVVGGRLAESRGRRPVAVIGLLVATVVQVAFFLSSGIALWITSTFAIIGSGASTLAIGTLDAELFPTETRGTSNSLLLICGVAGSATGLGVVALLTDPLGGLGRAIAVCGIAPFLAAIFLAPKLTETVGRGLDDISPSDA